mmetsp:Transcript_6264/g.11775  ORF Transcript_6264/g.11775 Transcript_6264/m.11775 type:complete len:256 (+) Transcript_6264:1422-2189(+)
MLQKSLMPRARRVCHYTSMPRCHHNKHDPLSPPPLGLVCRQRRLVTIKLGPARPIWRTRAVHYAPPLIRRRRELATSEQVMLQNCRLAVEEATVRKLCPTLRSFQAALKILRSPARSPTHSPGAPRPPRRAARAASATARSRRMRERASGRARPSRLSLHRAPATVTRDTAKRWCARRFPRETVEGCGTLWPRGRRRRRRKRGRRRRRRWCLQDACWCCGRCCRRASAAWPGTWTTGTGGTTQGRARCFAAWPTG